MVLIGKCASWPAYHGATQSVGGTTAHPSLPTFRGFPQAKKEHRLTSKLFGFSASVAWSCAQNPANICVFQ